MAENVTTSPRPWRHACFMAFDADGRPLFHCGTVGRLPSEAPQSEANCALIVAAVNVHDDLVRALEFVRDLCAEELPHAKVGTGAEVALRHAQRRASEVLAKVGK